MERISIQGPGVRISLQSRETFIYESDETKLRS